MAGTDQAPVPRIYQLIASLAEQIEELKKVPPGAPVDLKPLTDRVEKLEKKKDMTLAADPKKPGAILTKTPDGYTIGLDL